MAHYYLIYSLILFPLLLNAQTLDYGCEAVNFGIDADIYANGSLFGNAAGFNTDTDDWFENDMIYPGNGIGIIDTTGAYYFMTQFQLNQNFSITRKMSVPLNSIRNGVRYMDAVYGRDLYGGNNATDTTAFTSASKNGENPMIWNTGPMNVTPKNDLIDCYGHLRRDGITPYDDMWLMVGFSRVSNTGSSYFDFELYAADITYDNATGFTSAGADEGHTAWQFDAAGNITRIGDFVMTVDFSTNQDPNIELRIWVSRNDYQTITPVNFNYGTQFDGASTASNFGYAEILPLNASSVGCGLSNSAGSAAPPWGTRDPGGNFTFVYDRYQLVEIGVNLNALGIDPSLSVNYDGTNACIIPFSAIMFKARASQSFTAQLKDFSGPYPFGVMNTIPVDIVGDTIDCETPIVELYPAIVTADAYYHWETIDGNILTNPDSSHILVDSPGTYILHGAPSFGCLEVSDTFVVIEDIVVPNAYILSDTVWDCGNAIAHLMGGEDGYTYNWTGPNGYTSTSQDIIVSTPGTYILEVINQSVFCADYDTIYFPDYPCTPLPIGTLPSDSNIVVVIDSIAPTFSPPADITLLCDEDYTNLTITGDATDEYDNCDPFIGQAVYSDTLAMGCTGTGVITRTWVLTDGCGNQTSFEQAITLIDTVPPTFTVPADITVDCDIDINDVTITGDVTDETDNCDGLIGEATYTDSINMSVRCIGSGSIHRSWELTDACGNVTTHVQLITIIDTIGPIFTIPPDVTLSCETDISNLAITGDVLDESDNCDPNPGEATYIDSLAIPQPCSGSRWIQRIWSLHDACGNETVQIQNLFLIDTIAPEFTVPADVTIDCSMDVNDLLTVGDVIDESDNCDLNIGQASYVDSLVAGDPCGGSSVIYRLWSLSDGCNNTVEHLQQITLIDTICTHFYLAS